MCAPTLASMWRSKLVRAKVSVRTRQDWSVLLRNYPWILEYFQKVLFSICYMSFCIFDKSTFNTTLQISVSFPFSHFTSVTILLFDNGNEPYIWSRVTRDIKEGKKNVTAIPWCYSHSVIRIHVIKHKFVITQLSSTAPYSGIKLPWLGRWLPKGHLVLWLIVACGAPDKNHPLGLNEMRELNEGVLYVTHLHQLVGVFAEDLCILLNLFFITALGRLYQHQQRHIGLQERVRYVVHNSLP